MAIPLKQDRSPTLLIAGLLATLALLLAHAWSYRFLTDDAFISFRYAINLAEGHGLVFNPGERVEGYSNFLWVLALALFARLGATPEITSLALSLALTVVLWTQVARFAARRGWDTWCLLPPLFLAMTRSVAVWSTSGLETRCYEVLVVAAIFRLVHETEGGGRLPLAGLLLGLASLTRPEGPLIAMATLGTATYLVRSNSKRRRLVLFDGAVFGGLAGAHLIFRLRYYGEWLPNTYHAKVGGESWWEMGTLYLQAFVIEYAAWLWIPPLFAAALYHRRRGSSSIPLLFCAAVAPHALYVVGIGGDHFEYRPLDLYFPFIFILLADGLREISSRLGPKLASALALLVALGLLALPFEARRQFRHTDYLHGFPGLWWRLDPEARSYLEPSRAILYRLPGLRWLAARHQAAVRELTVHYVGLRAEEHEQFSATVIAEGKALRRLVLSGELMPTTRIATDSVGAIPYYSRLPTLDRLGLTDRQVARQPMGERRVLAHDKRASFAYGASRDTDLWAVHDVHLIFQPEDPLLLELARSMPSSAGPVFARTSEGILLARLTRDDAASRRRLPGLDLARVDERSIVEVADVGIERLRRAVAQNGADRSIKRDLARLLAQVGKDQEATEVYEQLLREEPGNPGILRAGATLKRRLGDLAGAAALWERLIASGWGSADELNNLGNVRVLQNRFEDGVELYLEALETEPGRIPTLLNLAGAYRRQQRPRTAIDAVERALEVQPKDTAALLAMAELRAEEGNRLAALAYYAEAAPSSTEAELELRRLQTTLRTERQSQP